MSLDAGLRVNILRNSTLTLINLLGKRLIIMRKLCCLIVTLMLISYQDQALALDPQPVGQLGVEIIASASKNFIDNWTKTPFKKPVYIDLIDNVKVEQTFFIAVVVTGYSLDDKGKTDLVGSFVLQNPDGSAMFNEPTMFSQNESMSHPQGFLILDPTGEVTLEEGDQKGKYIIKSIVRDNVSGKEAAGEYEVNLK